MKKLFISLMLFLSITLCHAQDFNTPINRNWVVLAEDTNLTYRQITHLCDSLFADAGFFAVDTTEDTSGNDTSEGGRGNAFTRWYMWADNRRSICPVGGDIFAPLGRELMHYLTTPTGYCAAMAPYTPNWKCIGPYNNYYGSGVQDHAGRINCVWANSNNIAHLRAGANSGGLWETRDTGHTWRCITDRVTTGAYGTQIPGTVAVSAMAVSPLDTNEIHLRLSTIATSGKSYGYDMGIIHSFDGGQNWYHDAVFRSTLDALAFSDFSIETTVGMKFVPGSSKIYSIKNNKIFFNDGTGSWSIKSPGTGSDIKRVTDIEYSRTTPNVALFSADNHDQELHVYSYNYVTDAWAEYDVVVLSPHDTVNWDYISDMSVSSGDTLPYVPFCTIFFTSIQVTTVDENGQMKVL